MMFVHAVYRDPKTAAAAVDALVDEGFASQDIGAVLYTGQGVQDLPIGYSTGVRGGAAVGGLLGGATGVLVMLLGFSSWADDMWLQIARGFAAGAGFGVLIGVLGGLGYWKVSLNLPKAAFRRGARVLLGVATNEGRVGVAKRTLLRAGSDLVRLATSRGADDTHVAVRKLEP